MSLTITSPVFAEQKNIPLIYTSDSKDISPPLSWSGVPKATKSLALIMEDPDAPIPAKAKKSWVHWILYNLPATSQGVPEAVKVEELGAHEGLNSWDFSGYGGPCPVVGRHQYLFKLYALDNKLPDNILLDKDKLLQQIKGHVLEEAELVGFYQHGD